MLLSKEAQPFAQHQQLHERAGCGGAEADDVVRLEKGVQLIAGVMIKCNFTHLRPLAAVASLLFHTTGQPLELS